jgi:hypothetical protein
MNPRRPSTAAALVVVACLSAACARAPERDTSPAQTQTPTTQPPATATARSAATPPAIATPPHRPDSVRLLASFDDYVFTEEHQYGYEVELYLLGDSLTGLFSHSEGLIGDTPTGLIDVESYDPRSGALRFKAKLSTGITWDDERRSVPSRDLYTFEGTIAGDSLSGVLEWRDMLHTKKIFTERDTVTLKRRGNDADRADAVRSREDWERLIQTILARLGPKW